MYYHKPFHGSSQEVLYSLTGERQVTDRGKEPDINPV
jgi:hypothetical protein